MAQIAFLQKDVVEAREAQSDALEELLRDKRAVEEQLEILKQEVSYQVYS